MKKKILIIICSLLIIGAAIVIWSINNNEEVDKNNQPQTQSLSTSNVKIIDGIQYITVLAKKGYSPEISQAQGGIPTKLIIKTENTRDCSSIVVIRSIKYNKILQTTGEETIDLQTPTPGKKINGTCSMGMYSFSINFN